MGGAAAFALVQEAFAARAADVHAYSSGPARDALMCRRLYLDICGRLPTREEAESYIASRVSQKQEKLVDKLLNSSGFADYWSMRYCDFLRVKSEFPINLWPNAVYVYHRRIWAAIQNDEPWNDFARALLYGRGSNFRVAESNFLRATARRTPEGLAEAATISFLLDPALEPSKKPFSFDPSSKSLEKYAEHSKKYARYFSRVAWKSTREWKEELVYLKEGPADATPEAFMAELEGPLAKKFYATPLHRVHWWLYGSYAPAGTLNDWMSAFRAGGWRLKPLLRHVFASSAYRAMPATPGKKNGFPARRLDAEVLDDAICDITGAVRSFESIAPEPFSFLPPKRRSILVEDGSITSAFLLLFGRSPRDSGLMDERSNKITAKQRLYLYNSGKLWDSLGAMVAEERFAKMDAREQVKELYFRFLSRPPDQAEYFLFTKKESVAPRDIAWHLMNTREFIYRI